MVGAVFGPPLSSMAKRTLAGIADLVEDRLDKDRNDTVFDAFVQDMCVLTFQEMTAEVPWARWLLDEVSLNPTVSGTQYIVMPSDMDIDSLISITDRTNTQRRVTRITPQDADLIDPGRTRTGDEILWWYQRVETGAGTWEDRIYFFNQPDSADTLKAIFGTLAFQPSASQSFPLPEKYEPILMEGAISKCYDRLDATSPAKDKAEAKFQKGLLLIKRDANRAIEESPMASHRPIKNAFGIQGAQFPSNFDVS